MCMTKQQVLGQWWLLGETLLQHLPWLAIADSWLRVRVYLWGHIYFRRALMLQ